MWVELGPRVFPTYHGPNFINGQGMHMPVGYSGILLIIYPKYPTGRYKEDNQYISTGSINLQV